MKGSDSPRSIQKDGDDCSVISATTGGSMSPSVFTSARKHGTSSDKPEEVSFPALHLSAAVSPIIPVQCQAEESNHNECFTPMENSWDSLGRNTEPSAAVEGLEMTQCIRQTQSEKLFSSPSDISGLDMSQRRLSNEGDSRLSKYTKDVTCDQHAVIEKLPCESGEGNKDCLESFATEMTVNEKSSTPQTPGWLRGLSLHKIEATADKAEKPQMKLSGQSFESNCTMGKVTRAQNVIDLIFAHESPMDEQPSEMDGRDKENKVEKLSKQSAVDMPQNRHTDHQGISEAGKGMPKNPQFFEHQENYAESSTTRPPSMASPGPDSLLGPSTQQVTNQDDKGKSDFLNVGEQYREERPLPLTADRQDCKDTCNSSVSSSLILNCGEEAMEASPPIEVDDAPETREESSSAKVSKRNTQLSVNHKSSDSEKANYLKVKPCDHLEADDSNISKMNKKVKNSSWFLAQSEWNRPTDSCDDTVDTQKPDSFVDSQCQPSKAEAYELSQEETVTASQNSKPNKKDLPLLVHQKEVESLKLLISLYDKLSIKLEKGLCPEAEQQVAKFDNILSRLKKSQDREKEKLNSSKKRKDRDPKSHQARLARLQQRQELLKQAASKHSVIVKRVADCFCKAPHNKGSDRDPKDTNQPPTFSNQEIDVTRITSSSTPGKTRPSHFPSSEDSNAVIQEYKRKGENIKTLAFVPPCKKPKSMFYPPQRVTKIPPDVQNNSPDQSLTVLPRSSLSSHEPTIQSLDDYSVSKEEHRLSVDNITSNSDKMSEGTGISYSKLSSFQPAAHDTSQAPDDLILNSDAVTKSNKDKSTTQTFPTEHVTNKYPPNPAYLIAPTQKYFKKQHPETDQTVMVPTSLEEMTPHQAPNPSITKICVETSITGKPNLPITTSVKVSKPEDRAQSASQDCNSQIPCPEIGEEGIVEIKSSRVSQLPSLATVATSCQAVRSPSHLNSLVSPTQQSRIHAQPSKEDPSSKPNNAALCSLTGDIPQSTSLQNFQDVAEISQTKECDRKPTEASILTKPTPSAYYQKAYASDSLNVNDTSAADTQVKFSTEPMPTPPSPSSSISSCLFSVGLPPKQIMRNTPRGKETFLNQNQQILVKENSLECDSATIRSPCHIYEPPTKTCSFPAPPSSPGSTISSNLFLISAKEIAKQRASGQCPALELESREHTEQPHCSSTVSSDQISRHTQGLETPDRLNQTCVNISLQNVSLPEPCGKNFKSKANKQQDFKKPSAGSKDYPIPTSSSTLISSFAQHCTYNNEAVQMHVSKKKTKVTSDPKVQPSENFVTLSTTKKGSKAKGRKSKKSSNPDLVNQGHISDYFSRQTPNCTGSASGQEKVSNSSSAAVSAIATSLAAARDINKTRAKTGLPGHVFKGSEGKGQVPSDSINSNKPLSTKTWEQILEPNPGGAVKFKTVHLIRDAELFAGGAEFEDFWSENFSEIRMTEEFWRSVDVW